MAPISSPPTADAASAAPPLLFLLSFGGREALAELAEGCGWSVVAAQRPEEAERRFADSEAAVALIDARGAAIAGETAVRALAPAAEARGVGLLAIAEASGDVLDRLLDAGATHVLAAPIDEVSLRRALRSAERHTLRLADRSATPQPSRAASPARQSLAGPDKGGKAGRWLAAQMGEPVVALFVGIVRFDMINAAFGREVGDALLRGAARRIERLLSPGTRSAPLARLAGPDFLLLFPRDAHPEADLLAGQILEAVARPFVSGDHAVTLSPRAAIVIATAGETTDQLLRRGEALLAGTPQGAVGRQDRTGGPAAAVDQRLEIDLRAALDRDEIEILFQPQVAVTSGRVVGAEALARWRHPELGELGAAPLFAAAARSDYLVSLSTHVQRKALAIAAGWTGPAADLGVAVNVTAADIARPDFAEQFTALVADAGIAAGRVSVEVTEDALIEDLAGAAALLARLRAAGHRVAIDDFGTGYSSLAYLKALPLDTLKIDRRLAQDITGSTRDRVVVTGAIGIARSLGLTVLAEGVETEEQLAALAAEGCSYYQGFLKAPPLTSAALGRLIAREERGS